MIVDNNIVRSDTSFYSFRKINCKDLSHWKMIQWFEFVELDLQFPLELWEIPINLFLYYSCKVMGLEKVVFNGFIVGSFIRPS